MKSRRPFLRAPEIALRRAGCAALSAVCAGQLLLCVAIPQQTQPAADPEQPPAALENVVVEQAEKTSEQEAGALQDGLRDERRDRRGRPLTTIFSGAELLREIIERDGAEVVRITIQGGAQIRHNRIEISAARMVIEGGESGRLEGGVTVIDRDSGARLRAAQAVYSRSEQIVQLIGNPQLLSSPAGQQPALLTCTAMKRDLAGRTTSLDGDVRIHQDQWTIVGDRAVYEDATRILTMANAPMIFGRTQFLTGDQLTYNTASREAGLDGRAIFLSSDRPDTAPAIVAADDQTVDEFLRSGGELQRSAVAAEVGPTALSADSIRYAPAAGAGVRTIAEGQVLITRAGMRIATPAVSAYGRDLALVHTDRGVEMLDRNENISVRAGVMEYDRQLQRLRLEGSPEIGFLRPGSAEVQAALRGAAIERSFAEHRTTAYGSVEIQREEYRATGELANYFEEQGVIILEGDPSIRSGVSRIHSEKILFYPETNRILLYNRIRGYLGGGAQ
ncbi:MAG: hypothetical protein K1X75_05170 [Leptospirales bacterium]|nr:hypothetical protein [Leptospirales bacterium]